MPPLEYLIPILVFVAVTAVGGAIVAVLRRPKPVERLRMVQDHGDGYRTTHADTSVRETSGLLDRIGQLVAGAGVSPQLRKRLASAGFSGVGAAPIYLGIKMLLLAGALLGAASVAMLTDWSTMAKGLVILWGAGLAFFIPNLVLEHCRRKRRQEIRSHLPDAVDLLEVCVSAGMGLDMAWNAVTDEMRPVSTALADEMTLTNLEMQLGAQRAVAMRRMAERTGAEELSSLVAMFIQTERFGTSVSEMLRSFATSMRENRSLRAEEAAEKMAVKLLFPMVLCVFPVTLIATVGPAGIAIAKMMTEN